MSIEKSEIKNLLLQDYFFASLEDAKKVLEAAKAFNLAQSQYQGLVDYIQFAQQGYLNPQEYYNGLNASALIQQVVKADNAALFKSLINAQAGFKGETVKTPMNGDTLLHIACRYGDAQDIQTVMQRYPQLLEVHSWSNSRKESPLHVLIQRADEGLLDKFLTAVLDKTAVARTQWMRADLTGLSPLDSAIQTGQASMVNLLLKNIVPLSNASPKVETQLLHSALTVAASQGSLDLLKALLDDKRITPNVLLSHAEATGASLWMLLVKRYHLNSEPLQAIHVFNSLAFLKAHPKMPEKLLSFKNKDGETVLYAVRSQEILKLITQTPGFSNELFRVKDRHQDSVVLNTIRQGNVAALASFLEYAECRQLMREPDASGQTALHYAIASGKIDMVKVLLDTCEDPLQWLLERHNGSNSAFHTAIYSDSNQMTDFLLSKVSDPIGLLKRSQDALDQHNAWNLLVETQKISSVSAAIFKKIPLDVWSKKDATGKNAFHMACRTGDWAVLQRINKDLSPSFFKQLNVLPDKSGKVALHHAVEYGHATVVQMLLNDKTTAKALLKTRDLEGRTPLQLAFHLDKTNVLEAFLYSKTLSPLATVGVSLYLLLARTVSLGRQILGACVGAMVQLINVLNATRGSQMAAPVAATELKKGL